MNMSSTNDKMKLSRLLQSITTLLGYENEPHSIISIIYCGFLDFCVLRIIKTLANYESIFWECRDFKVLNNILYYCFIALKWKKIVLEMKLKREKNLKCWSANSKYISSWRRISMDFSSKYSYFFLKHAN